MATSATARGAEPGDETPAGGGGRGREEAGECVSVLSHFDISLPLLNVFPVHVFARCYLPLCRNTQIYWYSRRTGTSEGTATHTCTLLTHTDAEVFVETGVRLQRCVFLQQLDV